MKKIIFLIMATLFSFAIAAGSAKAADKLGYVDLAKLFDGYPKTEEYAKTLAAKEKAYEAERDKKVGEIKQLQEKYTLLSEKEKEAKRSELENKIRALEDFDRNRQEQLLKERDEKLKEILKDIESAVEKYAQAQGYTFIFNDRMLVYQNKAFDITDKVMEILKASAKGK